MASFLQFFESLVFPYVYRPLVAAIFLCIVCSFLGVYVILRKMVFLVDGIAHSAFAGGTLAILLNLSPVLTIGFFGLITTLGMGYLNEKGKLNNETAIGIMFSFTMALGIIFIGLIKSYTTGVNALLFGSITTISSTELVLIFVVGFIIIVTLFFIRKSLFFITMDEELAYANGIPVRRYSYLFLILTAAIIIVGLKAMGVILLLAFIVTPGAAAYQLTYNFNRLIGYAIGFAIFGAITGYILGFLLEIAPSASIAVVLTLIFLVTFFVSPKRRQHKARIDEANCQICQKAVNQTEECQFCEETQIHLQSEIRPTHSHSH